jgi:hypothetical protein
MGGYEFRGYFTDESVHSVEQTKNKLTNKQLVQDTIEEAWRMYLVPTESWP